MNNAMQKPTPTASQSRHSGTICPLNGALGIISSECCRYPKEDWLQPIIGMRIAACLEWLAKVIRGNGAHTILGPAGLNYPCNKVVCSGVTVWWSPQFSAQAFRRSFVILILKCHARSLWATCFCGGWVFTSR